MRDIAPDKIADVIRGFYIPPKPDLLVQIQDEAAKPDPNISSIANIISRDVGLSANVLKMINSPMYGLTRHVSDIKQSVVLLGLQNIINLVSFHELRRCTEGHSKVSLDRFWDTAMEIAQFVVPTHAKLGLKGRCLVEDAYALGLFHDCGIALMAMKYEDYKSVLQEANGSECEFTEIEEKHYKTNHAILGYFMAASWKLPDNICELILRHHERDVMQDATTPEKQKDLLGVLLMAINIQHKYCRLKDHPDWLVMCPSVCAHFAISETDYAGIEADVIADVVDSTS